MSELKLRPPKEVRCAKRLLHRDALWGMLRASHSMSSTVRERLVPVPEPELTPDAMIERAIALRPRLLAEQDETERRSVHSEAIHEEFRKAGFYRCL
jgi:hypothetical protein